MLAHLSLPVVKYMPREQTKFARRTIPLRFGYAQQRFPVPEIICLAHEPLCWLLGISVLKRALMLALPVLFLCYLLIRDDVRVSRMKFTLC